MFIQMCQNQNKNNQKTELRRRRLSMNKTMKTIFFYMKQVSACFPFHHCRCRWIYNYSDATLPTVQWPGAEEYLSSGKRDEWQRRIWSCRRSCIWELLLWSTRTHLRLQKTGTLTNSMTHACLIAAETIWKEEKYGCCKHHEQAALK